MRPRIPMLSPWDVSVASRVALPGLPNFPPESGPRSRQGPQKHGGNPNSPGNMAVYRISYDLSGEGNDYEPFWNRLHELGAIKILKSEWLIAKPDKDQAGAIAVDLRKHVALTGSLFIQE